MRGANRRRRRAPIHTDRPTSWWAPGSALVILLLSGSVVPLIAGVSGATSQLTSGESTTGPAAAGTVVPLIPSSAAFRLAGSPQDPEPSPVTTGDAFAYPDLYNAAAGHGNATLAEPQPGAPLTTTIDFSNVSGRTPGVVGYPELQYGPKPWCAKASCAAPPTDRHLSLPMLVRSLPEVTAVADYAIGSAAGPTTGSFDLAYDLWMTRSPRATSASAGDLELMVWLDHEGGSILPGTPTATFWLATLWSDRWTLLPWQLYLQSTVPADAAGHWTVAYLVLDPPAAAATVGVDLSEMIRSADSALAALSPGTWGSSGGTGASDPSALYLDDIELGSEFRPFAVAGPAHYAWTLTGYCFQISASMEGTSAVPPALAANCTVLSAPPPLGPGTGLNPLSMVGVAGVTVASLGVAAGARLATPDRRRYR